MKRAILTTLVIVLALLAAGTVQIPQHRPRPAEDCHFSQGPFLAFMDCPGANNGDGE